MHQRKLGFQKLTPKSGSWRMLINHFVLKRAVRKSFYIAPFRQATNSYSVLESCNYRGRLSSYCNGRNQCQSVCAVSEEFVFCLRRQVGRIWAIITMVPKEKGNREMLSHQDGIQKFLIGAQGLENWLCLFYYCEFCQVLKFNV